MKPGQLKHPMLLRFIILIIGTFGLVGLSWITRYCALLVVVAAMLLAHHTWPSRLGWRLIISFVVLPILLLIGVIWGAADFSLDFRGPFGTAIAVFFITLAALALLIFYATQVNNDSQ
ncbi:hypothetical protein [Herbaspirillum rubrisubalbicans]|uniref:hypothetical protein n=1 Tax=Herbaspirillum rubrisubalbicans TaxID=80842 RepID=UPI0015C52592|nr:hypothetical protein [Herbaspirillum rubrisubalbicans]